MFGKRRLGIEMKNWRNDHPPGFTVKFSETDDTLKENPFKWECVIPGKKGTNWEGGEYKLMLDFPEDYPSKPPKCQFTPPLFHPNVFPSGTVCLSILHEDEDWKSSITVKEILLGIQDLLDNPNPKSPAHRDAFILFIKENNEYQEKIKEQALRFSPENHLNSNKNSLM